MESCLCQSESSGLALIPKLAFKVVELTLDANDIVIDRRVVPILI
jgi:hypothetical protein